MRRLENNQKIKDDTKHSYMNRKSHDMIVAKKIDIPDPLSIAMQIAEKSLWNYERMLHDELIIDIPGHWGEYRFHLCWQPESHIFYMACFLDLKVPEIVPIGIYELLSLINCRLWMGHFDLVEDQWVVFRYSLLLHIKKIADLTSLIEELIDTIVAECETFYPVFGNLLTHNILPRDALQMGLIDTVGEA